jgi:hypothetical protein
MLSVSICRDCASAQVGISNWALVAAIVAPVGVFKTT